MANLGNLDFSNYGDSFGIDPLPPDWYEVAITSSEMKPTRDGGSNYLKLTLTVTSGSYKGRQVLMNLNIHNPNVVAKEIALKQLGAISRCCGVIRLSESTQLHNIAFEAKVAVKKDTNGIYADQNNVISVRKIGEGFKPKESQPSSPFQRSQAGNPQTPPFTSTQTPFAPSPTLTPSQTTFTAPPATTSQPQSNPQPPANPFANTTQTAISEPNDVDLTPPWERE